MYYLGATKNRSLKMSDISLVLESILAHYSRNQRENDRLQTQIRCISYSALPSLFQVGNAD